MKNIGGGIAALSISAVGPIISHLICNLISENQGLEKLRSVSNLRKISGPAHMDFFFSLSPKFFQVYGINFAFFLGGDLEKNPGLQDLNFF